MTNKKNGRPIDALSSMSAAELKSITCSLVELFGSVNELSSCVGLSKTVVYAAMQGGGSEKTAQRMLGLFKAINSASNAAQSKEKKKQKPLKQDLDDISIAHKYCIKSDRAKKAGHEFALTFEQYKNLIMQPTCYYTDVLLSRCKGKSEDQIDTDLTLDRVDNNYGYIDGNVVACCYAANQLKAYVENPMHALEINGALKVLKRAKEFMNNMEIK